MVAQPSDKRLRRRERVRFSLAACKTSPTSSPIASRWRHTSVVSRNLWPAAFRLGPLNDLSSSQYVIHNSHADSTQPHSSQPWPGWVEEEQGFAFVILGDSSWCTSRTGDKLRSIQNKILSIKINSGQSLINYKITSDQLWPFQVTNPDGMAVNGAVLKTQDIAKDLHTSAQGESVPNFLPIKIPNNSNIAADFVRWILAILARWGPPGEGCKRKQKPSEHWARCQGCRFNTLYNIAKVSIESWYSQVENLTAEAGSRSDLRLEHPYLFSATTRRPRTTTSTTSTTTKQPVEGVDLELVPGFCINISFSGVGGCRKN